MNEVLIPLDEELLLECIDVEKRALAGLEEGQKQEQSECIKNAERVFDVLCKRYPKRAGRSCGSA